MRDAEFARRVGAENICLNITEALKRAEVVFEEMNATSPPAPS